MPAVWLNECTSVEGSGTATHKATIGIAPRARRVNGTLRAIEPRVVDAGSDPLRLRAYGVIDCGIAATLDPGEPVVGIRRNGRGLALVPLGVNARVGTNVLDGQGNIIGRQWAGAWAGARLRFFFGGHFVRKEIELSAGHPSTFDFKILRAGDWNGNLPRLTARGFDVDDDAGRPLMWAHKPYLFKPGDETTPNVPVNMLLRQVAGEWYLRLQLPPGNWAGWTLEPTFSSQPAAAEGIDVMLVSDFADTNFGTDANLGVGENKDTVRVYRSLVKFVLSAIPASASILSANWKWYVTNDVSVTASTFRIYRQKRAWVEAEATWNNYSTGNNWATAGGFGAADCEQTDIGSRDFTATETLNEFKEFTLTASKVQEWVNGTFANNGFLVKADTESDDGYYGPSSDHATAANRPKLEMVYTVPSGGIGRRRAGVLGLL